MARAGAAFEKAIFEFFKAIDPEADVRFNHRVKDIHTGVERQADVWIVYRPASAFTMTALISCKDHERRLDVGAIDSFYGEIASMGANVGVLYSRSGFTGQALIQAKSRGIVCCKFFQDAPPELPHELFFEAYAAHPVYSIVAEFLGSGHAPMDLTWDNVLRTTLRIGGTPIRGVDAVLGLLFGLLSHSVESDAGNPERPGPQDGNGRMDWPECAACPALRLRAVLTWDWFQGRLNAFRVSGSLNVSEGSLTGSTTTPPMFMHHTPHPSGWKRVPFPPPIKKPRIRYTATALAMPSAESVLNSMGPCLLFGGPCQFTSPPGELLEHQLQNSIAGLEPPGWQAMSVTAYFGKQPK